MQRIVLFGFMATIALVPVALGSNRDWSWSPLAGVIGLLLVARACTFTIQPDPQCKVLAHTRSLYVPAGLFAVAMLWGGLQLSGWTPASWANPLLVSSAVAVPGVGQTVALDVQDALTGIMRGLTYAGVFLLAASLSEGRRESRSILGVIVLFGALYTLYAMVADVVNRQTLATGFTIWVPSGFSIWVPSGKFFSGTFVNANNYATYAGVIALTALLLAAPQSVSSERQESARQRWRRRIRDVSGANGLWLAAAIFLTAGVLLSGSRGGWLSLAAAVMAVFVVRARGFGKLLYLVLMPLLFVLLAFLLPGGDRLFSRTGSLITEGGEPGREALFALSLNAISLRPLLGWGMNSFSSLYPVFQPESTPVYYDKAHNTYLELAMDFGIPVASLLVLSVIWIVCRCLIGFFRRQRDRELAGLGFFASVLVGVHSLVDFSLQIPGMACTYFAILGVAWAQSWSSRDVR